MCPEQQSAFMSEHGVIHSLFFLSILLHFPSLFFRVQNIVSSSMRAKLAAYSLALLLHMNCMVGDLTLLHRDLGITEARY